jgi:hypothetical protein
VFKRNQDCVEVFIVPNMFLGWAGLGWAIFDPGPFKQSSKYL